MRDREPSTAQKPTRRASAVTALGSVLSKILLSDRLKVSSSRSLVKPASGLQFRRLVVFLAMFGIGVFLLITEGNNMMWNEAHNGSETLTAVAEKKLSALEPLNLESTVIIAHDDASLADTPLEHNLDTSGNPLYQGKQQINTSSLDSKNNPGPSSLANDGKGHVGSASLAGDDSGHVGKMVRSGGDSGPSDVSASLSSRPIDDISLADKDKIGTSPLGVIQAPPGRQNLPETDITSGSSAGEEGQGFDWTENGPEIASLAMDDIDMEHGISSLASNLSIAKTGDSAILPVDVPAVTQDDNSSLADMAPENLTSESPPPPMISSSPDSGTILLSGESPGGADSPSGSSSGESPGGTDSPAGDFSGESPGEPPGGTYRSSGDSPGGSSGVENTNETPSSPMADTEEEREKKEWTTPIPKPSVEELARWKAFRLGPPVNDWDEKRQAYLADHPGAHLNRFGKPRVMMVTATDDGACLNEEGDHLLLKLMKNKMDYARLMDMEIYWNQGILRPDFDIYWSKYPLLRALMLEHPQVEWFWWIDADAMITDMEFEIPWSRYESTTLFLNGWDYLVHHERSWTSINAGVFLIRNSKRGLDLLDEWASYGPKGDVRWYWGPIFTKGLTGRPSNFDADDQAALLWIILNNNETWGKHIYIESGYDLHSFWLWVVKTYEKRKAEYRPEMWGNRWAFVTHFVGCKICRHVASYPMDECAKGIQRAFNFADNQLLKIYGYEHPTLSDKEIVPINGSQSQQENSTLKGSKRRRILSTSMALKRKISSVNSS